MSRADFWATIVIIVFAVMHLYQISAPPNGYHVWRESDTAVVAYNYFQHDLPFFSPATNELQSMETGIGIEFPIYCWLVAQGYELAGFTHVIPHLLTLLFGILGLFAFYRLLKMLSISSIAVFGTAALAFAPVYFYYAYKIVPDMMMMGLMLTAMWLYVLFLNDRRWWQLLLSGLLLGLGATLKPFPLAMFLPLLWLSYRQTEHRKKNLAAFGLFAILAILPPLTWVLTTGWLVTRTGHVGWFYEYVFTEGFVRTFFLRWTWELFIGWMLVIPFAIGVYAAVRKRVNPFFPILLLAGVIVIMLMAVNSRSHDYYSLVLTPGLACFTAVGLTFMWRYRWCRVLALILLIAAPIGAFARIKHRFDSNSPYDAIRQDVDSAIPKNAQVVVNDNNRGAVRLYQLNREGWYVRDDDDRRKMIDYIQRGADFVVLDRPYDEFAPFLSQYVDTIPERVGILYSYRVTTD